MAHIPDPGLSCTPLQLLDNEDWESVKLRERSLPVVLPSARLRVPLRPNESGPDDLTASRRASGHLGAGPSGNASRLMISSSSGPGGGHGNRGM